MLLGSAILEAALYDASRVVLQCELRGAEYCLSNTHYIYMYNMWGEGQKGGRKGGRGGREGGREGGEGGICSLASPSSTQ